jgi:subtilisin family serine protease
MDAIAATLRTQSGVESVTVAGAHRYSTSVTTPYYPNDPYFQGFTLPVAPSPGATVPPATYKALPYVENAGVPGQWDMHAIQLERAFAYSQPSNGSSFTNIAGALGSSSIKIAIIDTGEDPHQPELSTIAYQRCFITNPSGTQSSSNYETDPLGHGTDVAGIAAASTGNAFGFSAAGGNASIYAYRVFPTPDDNCANEGSTDQQCGASTTDIAAAIEDAKAQKVNIISMSLGGTTCGTGAGFAANGDSDVTEGAAVQDAINAGIIVVAASGNSGGTGVAAPACDTGVIAAGASALDDGVANATGHTGGSAASPVEYVASYTQYGTTNTYQSASSWGIVAPGGDPLNDTDNDDLHWIENIWTSTPYQLNSSDKNFIGECTDDYPNSTGTTSPVDCRTLIAGTSMATPHVAGVAALVLAVSGTKYASPAAMKSLLCQTADNIGGNQGCGRVNAYRAVATALGDTP